MTDDTLQSEFTLRDGTLVRVRPIEPRDGRTLQAAFRELSPESRRRRFLGPKNRLSERELRALTQADGDRRLALGAVRLDRDGWECEGLGVAHYTRIAGQPEVAAPSMTVLDSAQGAGLGRALAEELMRAASARGVKTFRCLLSDEHGWLRERIARAYPHAQLTRRGPLLGAEFELPALARVSPDLADRARAERPWSLLRWIAEGTAKPSAGERLLDRLLRRFRERR